MSEYLTLTAIRSRGWPARLIGEILGEPDATRRNPYYRSGPPVKLWSLARVEAAERDEGVKAHLAGRSARSERAAKAAAT